MKELLEGIFRLSSIAIIGMEKNVGKTTTLNYFIEEARHRHSLGLTSIGVDGEAKDQVTGTEKPTIYVYRDTLLATASRSFHASDITKEILETTGIYTPLGEIVIFKALSDGYVELVGPSINKQLVAVIERLQHFGSKTVIIDGALSRSSTAAPSVAEGVILATGAALSSDIDKVVDSTFHKVRLLSVEIETSNIRRAMLQEAFSKGKVAFIYRESLVVTEELTALGGERAVKERFDSGASAVIIGGVVGDRLAEYLCRYSDLSGKVIYVEDGTKLFISENNYTRLINRGCIVKALNPVKLIAVSVNPFSHEGYSLDSVMLCQQLHKKIRLPVIDVVGNIGVGL